MMKIITKYYKGMAKNPFTYIAIAAYVVAMISLEPGSRDFSITAIISFIVGIIFFLIAQACLMFNNTKRLVFEDILSAIDDCNEEPF